ncbi:MAG: endo-1,4-beta-xylanase [Bacteroidaceae bacterium]|nr:endo-1,4-beta-xylanase [Bacteroidaceae bacterium]
MRFFKTTLLASALVMGVSVQGQGLKDAYQDYFSVGVAVNMSNLNTARNPKDMEIILTNYNSITAENDFKPQSVQPQEGQWNFANADAIADFCREHGIKLRGHCLVWHSQVGRWMFQDKDADGKNIQASKEKLYERMKTHITTIVQRYSDIVYCWDVVNEAVTDDANATDPLRPSQWKQIAGGDEFIRKAFEFAHEADPNALLFYNDYNAAVPAKRDKIYNMVKEMKEAGVPIDGIGMQGHFSIYDPSLEDIEAAIVKYSEIVDHIQFTELDIRVNRETGGGLNMNRQGEEITPERQQMFNDKYTGFFDVVRRHADVVDVVTFWNVSDRDTWLGTSNYPLLFDKDANAKETYYMVRDFKVTDKDKKKAEKDAIKASKKKDANRAADEKAALAQKNFKK